MNKKLLLIFVTAILLACNFLIPPKPTATPEAISGSSDSESLTAEGFTIVRLHPKDGNLQNMLAGEAQKASALGQMPVAEFDATWCPPCQAIDAGIKSKNELMLKAYSGMYIIKLDVDEWGWNNGKVQDFRFDAIPVYFKLDSKGQQTGKVIDGGAWGEDIPENIAPVMDKFFHGE
ncbi:MAG TPA: thioredoxin family protein [Anaerolineales bacterium]|nr:thioredoxin family protein [Anaerolineales bacterium]